MRQLTGKAGESLLIGENIRITVLEIKGSQTRIGIQSPEGRMQVVYRPLYPVPSSGKHPEQKPLIPGKCLSEEIEEQME